MQQVHGFGRSHRARGVAPRTGTARSVRAIVGMILLTPHLTGCYQYVPVREPVPPVGSEVTLRLTDQGRIALTQAVGPGVLDMRGHVLANTDTSMVLAVQTVNFIDLAIPARMNGLRVEVPRAFAFDLRERRLSKGRSIVAAGLAFLVVALASTIGLTVAGGGDIPIDMPNEGGGGNQS